MWDRSPRPYRPPSVPRALARSGLKSMRRFPQTGDPRPRAAATSVRMSTLDEHDYDDVRSLLFVPGDSHKKIAKSRGLPADVIIYDLEDAVMPERRAEARLIVADALSAERPAGQRSCVRINPLKDEDALADLAGIIDGAPDLVMLPKMRTAEDVVTLSNYLDALETRAGIPPGRIHIVAIATETAESLLTLSGLRGCSRRLMGLTWGAEDLAGALGASSNKDAAGHWEFTYQLARSQSLIAARAADLQPIDTVYTDFRDGEGLAASCMAARRDGFTGKLAIHPAQVETINAAFTPTEEEAAHAQRVIDLFDENPGVGALQLDGGMIDLPHLRQARRIVARYQRALAG